MARKTNFREILNFRGEKGPGYTISPSFYLSVMAAQMPLPTIRKVINPKATDGAVLGFGVPMQGDKEDLDRPMERGTYVIASIDRKTVIRTLVISKEEAGFDPAPFLRSEHALTLSSEAQARMSATWTLIQLTFESYDPKIHPAVRLLYETSARLAELTGGLVADPICQVYNLPEQVVSPLGEQPFAVQDFVKIHSTKQLPTAGMFTLGLQKFNLPELEINGINEEQAPAAARLILGVGQTILKGQTLEPGASVGSKTSPFRIATGGLDRSRWEGIPCLEVIPEQNEDINGLIARWDAETR